MKIHAIQTGTVAVTHELMLRGNVDGVGVAA